MALLGFIGGSIAGMVLCRLTGGPGPAGVGRGFGIGLAGVLGFITLLGGLAWLSREVEPLIGGQPLDVAVEIRLAGGRTAAGDGPRRPYTYVSMHFRQPAQRTRPAAAPR